MYFLIKPTALTAEKSCRVIVQLMVYRGLYTSTCIPYHLDLDRFDTTIGGLQFADQFLQFAAKLPTTNVYGFGETEHHSLKHAMNWEYYGMWARDQPADVSKHLRCFVTI